jgi:hypothetical protein
LFDGHAAEVASRGEWAITGNLSVAAAQRAALRSFHYFPPFDLEKFALLKSLGNKQMGARNLFPAAGAQETIGKTWGEWRLHADVGKRVAKGVPVAARFRFAGKRGAAVWGNRQMMHAEC